MKGKNLRKLVLRIIVSCLLSMFALLILESRVFAQGESESPADENMDVEIPFIDRDGDGINDLVQNQWGLRFIKRYKRRHAIWEQIISEGKGENKLVDSDGDGMPETPFREYFKKKMKDKLIDEDGDGKPDMPLVDYMRQRFQRFDKDGDGLPDSDTLDQIKQHRRMMLEWRNQIFERLGKGETPFIDIDGDGVPDTLPPLFGGRHDDHHRK